VPPAGNTRNNCSFCGKSGDEARLIPGPGVCICDQCVRTCNDILAEEQPARDETESSKVAASSSRATTSAATGGQSDPPIFHIGSFTCPKCRITFDLHAPQPVDFIK
jgi:hypothetical protein